MILSSILWLAATAATLVLSQDNVSICQSNEIILSQNGSIVILTSPSPSENISSTGECALKLKAGSSNKIIQMNVTSFNLGGRDPCSPNEEHLSIVFGSFLSAWFDHRRTPVVGRGFVDMIRWCGQSYSANLETRQSMMLTYFGGLTDQRGSGFSIRLSLVDRYACGGSGVERVGDQPMYVYSPGYPEHYEGNMELGSCNWNLKAQHDGSALLLDTLRFSLEDHSSCFYDFLSINNERFCKDQRVQLKSRFNNFQISFRSDQSDEYDGFILKVVETPKDDENCGRDVVAGTSPISLQLPEVQNGPVVSVNCWWRVDSGALDKVVLLENSRFHTSASCDQLELRIYDGPNITGSNRILSSCAPVEMFRTIRSSSRFLYIDVEIHVAGYINTKIDVAFTVTSHKRDAVPPVLYAGFAESLIWLNLSSWNDRGLLLRGSEEDMGNYSTCLQLSLTGFPTNVSPLNITDYFYVFSGWNESFAELGRACGRSSSEMLISRGSKVYIVFYPSVTSNLRQVWLKYRLRSYCEPSIIDLQSSDTFSHTIVSDFAHYSSRLSYIRTINQYPNNAYCRWLIQAEGSNFFTQVGTIVSHLFPTGCDDNITAYDYRASQPTSLLSWCDDDDPVVLSSKGSSLLLEFITNYRDTGTGFHLNYSSVSLLNECPSMASIIADEDPEYLTSPNYPYNYPNNVDCRWRIKAKTGVVKVTPMSISIAQERPICSLSDFLVIYDGWDSSGRVLEDLCGSGFETSSITSSGVYMFLHFHSDGANTASGFRLKFQTTEDSATASCNKNVYVRSDQDSEITSPYFPNSYPGNTDCYWLVMASITHVVMLEVMTMDLPCSSPVILYDGSSTSSLVLANLCSSSHQKQYVTTQKAMYITFRSTSNYGYSGFHFRLRSWKGDIACLGQVQHLIAYTNKNYIQSPGYPQRYPPSTDCKWRIESAYRNMTIEVDIEDGDIEPSLYCFRDSLSVYDGYGTGSTQLGKYCGDHEQLFWSSSIYMFLHFQTDSIVQDKGFRLSFRAVIEKTTSAPTADRSSDSSVGAIIGGVLGGVVFLLVGITCFLCLVSRCHRRQSPSSPPSRRRHRRPSQSPSVVVMNPVIVNQMAPPPYPGVSNSAFISDDLPPAYSANMALPPPSRLDAPPPYSDAMMESHPPSPLGVARTPAEEVSRPEPPRLRQGYEYLDPVTEEEYSHLGPGVDHEYQTLSSTVSHVPDQQGDGDYSQLSYATSGVSQPSETYGPSPPQYQSTQSLAFAQPGSERSTAVSRPMHQRSGNMPAVEPRRERPPLMRQHPQEAAASESHHEEPRQPRPPSNQQTRSSSSPSQPQRQRPLENLPPQQQGQMPPSAPPPPQRRQLQRSWNSSSTQSPPRSLTLPAQDQQPESLSAVPLSQQPPSQLEVPASASEQQPQPAESPRSLRIRTTSAMTEDSTTHRPGFQHQDSNTSMVTSV